MNNLQYLEVSAKTGKKIGELFDQVIESINDAEKAATESLEVGDTRKRMDEVNGTSFAKVELKKEPGSQQGTSACCGRS